MDLGLHGRVVIVTGGSRGIGQSIAQTLIAEGAQVAICARDAGASDATAAELGQGCVSFCADVADDASVAGMVAAVGERFGRIDGVVNNAGRFGGGPVVELEDAALLEGLETKVVGPLRVVRHALPYLRASDQACVINVSGISAQKITPGAAVSAIANAGMLTLTAYLAHELITEAIRVNAVIPGYTGTGVWRARATALAESADLTHEGAMDAILERQAMAHSRWGEPEEIARVVVFLMSGAAEFVNGIALRVDGGQLPVAPY